MSVSIFRSLAAAAGAGALVLGMTACSGSDDSASNAPASDSSSSAEATPTTEPSSPESSDSTGSSTDSADALDQVVADEQASVDSVMDQYGDIYSDVSVSAEPPSTIVWEYVYADSTDIEAQSAAIEEQSADLQSQLDD